MEEAAPKHHWLVRTHYLMRSVSFALLFIATTLHLQGKGYGPLAWALLALLLLVYPHVQYWRACRSAHPVRAEMDNLLVDSLLLGMYAAGTGFSVWLSFSAMLGTMTNNAGNKGWRGVGQTLLAMPAGALAWIAGFGLDFAPETGWPTTLFCIAGLTGYLMFLGNIGFARNHHLRSIREDLRNREKELLAANDSLQKHLGEIDGLHEQLREQATRDPLTGLYNRRYLDSTLERELSRCKREGQPLALILIDLDHFKKINDTYGHPAGDEVLRRLGALLAGAARAGDLACRYGGEEFLLLMPTMTLATARERAEELRAAFGALAVEFGSFRLQATLSIGIAAFPGHGTSANELVRRADDALYLAKQLGRNRVQVAPGATDAEAASAESAAAGQAVANFVKLVWRAAYECGDPTIDDWHRGLFNRVNELLTAMLSARPKHEVGVLIDALVSDVAQHFRDEEAVLAASGFPGANDHAAVHAGLITRAGTLARRFHGGEIELGELFQFVADDMIARHLFGTDREFHAYLERRAGRADAAV